MALAVYELENRDEQNEFIDDLLGSAKNGNVPIYLATVVDRGESEDIDYNVVAMSVGKPIDPAELQAEVDKISWRRRGGGRGGNGRRDGVNAQRNARGLRSHAQPYVPQGRVSDGKKGADRARRRVT
jgi:hypothetical protein